MTNVRSWQFWVIVALALATMACAGRRERREEAAATRAERNEQKKAERASRNEQKRAQREGRAAEAPASPPPTQSAAPAAVFTPISTAPTSAIQEGKIVFLRTSSIGRLITASVFDVTESGPPQFINHVQTGDRVVYSAKPGLRTFMVVSEAADFMQADIQSGRTYYALVTPRMGAMRARFSFEPVRSSDRRIASLERAGRPTKPTPTALKWAEQNAPDIANKRERYWSAWSSKPESQRAGQTLNADDGR